MFSVYRQAACALSPVYEWMGHMNTLPRYSSRNVEAIYIIVEVARALGIRIDKVELEFDSRDETEQAHKRRKVHPLLHSVSETISPNIPLTLSIIEFGVNLTALLSLLCFM